MLPLIMVGINYKENPLPVREQVVFTPSRIERAYSQLKGERILKEAVILSTCNRSEIYGIVDDIEEGIVYLKEFYQRFFSLPQSAIKLVFRTDQEREVVQYVFEVASGFQSMILGEDQILGQVKNAYETSLAWRAGGVFLNKLFLYAITTAKSIKTATGISENPLSSAAIGIKLMEQHIKDLEDKKVLVIGLGEMSRVAIHHLRYRDVKGIYVTNRTRTKMVDFAAQYPEIIQIDFTERYEKMNEVDIIISCTSAPHFVVYKETFLQYYKGQELWILDLSVPRDVEPSIGNIEAIHLYEIDDLQKIVEENIEKRMKAVEIGMERIGENVDKYFQWVKKRQERAVNSPR